MRFAASTRTNRVGKGAQHPACASRPRQASLPTLQLIVIRHLHERVCIGAFSVPTASSCYAHDAQFFKGEKS
jgi:hypothetical protein